MQWYTQQLGHIGASALAWGRGERHGQLRYTTRLAGCQSLGLLHIGRVIAGRAINDGVFASRSNDLKLLTQVTPYGTTVSGHSPVTQTKPVKNGAVGFGHHLVADLGRRLVAVKAVGVFHDELATTHQPKARTALVTELGLDLIQVLRQLFVAFDFLTGDVGHHLFAGGLHHKIVAMTVLNTQQLRPHFFEPTGFHPQLGRLNHRHGQLNRTGAVHFFTHDLLDFAHHTQAHGHQGVDASAEFFDHARTHHELVADHFGIGGGLFEGGNKELGGFHGSNLKIVRVDTLDAKQRLCIMVTI